jgi:hypothetical protein
VIQPIYPLPLYPFYYIFSFTHVQFWPTYRNVAATDRLFCIDFQ